MAQPKIAIVCDWLTNMGGAERVILSLHEAYPEAPIYTSVFEEKTMPLFRGLDIRTTWLQRLPRFLRKKHQFFPVFRAFIFRRLDLSKYDIIISSASAEAKAVRKRPDAIHVCYCHTPTRYFWSHYEDYLKDPGFGWLNPLIRLVMPLFVHWMRRLDLQSVKGVDHFIANSSAVAARIKKYYHREAKIIHPPVNLDRFKHLTGTAPRRGFITLGRQVAYKRHDLVIQACTKLALPLTVYGDGPEHQRLVGLAGPTITFSPLPSDPAFGEALARAEAFVYGGEEDFGIVFIEALAAGTPLIVLGKGGAMDVVTPEVGLSFAEQTPESLSNALREFANRHFDPKKARARANQFSTKSFVRRLHEFVRTGE